MDFASIAIIFVLAIIIVGNYIKNVITKDKPKNNPETKGNNAQYIDGYKPKWVFTQNEKIAFRELKKITDEFNLHLLAKVRLFDLVEPKDYKNKGYMYKIQAKHVDFVICAENLVAKCIVELDDKSHQRADRKARDNFVDEVLKRCGYTVIHSDYINHATIKPQIMKAFNIQEKPQPKLEL